LQLGNAENDDLDLAQQILILFIFITLTWIDNNCPDRVKYLCFAEWAQKLKKFYQAEAVSRPFPLF
jgi:hypothetical protein